MEDVLVTLRRRMPQMSVSERRVAEAVITRPALVIESTITRLAEACSTSTGTVARMCRAAGFAGYKEFRIAVVHAHGREQTARELFRVSDAGISAADTLAELVAKVAYEEVRAIEETARTVDLDALEAVVSALRRAQRVDVFGAGASGLTAQDLQLKLHRIGIPTFCWADTHLALTSVAVSEADAVAIGISHSGVTPETGRFLRLARERGAVTAAITDAPGAPVAALADHVLTTAAREGAYRTGAMSSRVAQMALVDFVLVRLVQQDVGGAQQRLRATYEALHGDADISA